MQIRDAIESLDTTNPNTTTLLTAIAFLAILRNTHDLDEYKEGIDKWGACSMEIYTRINEHNANYNCKSRIVIITDAVYYPSWHASFVTAATHVVRVLNGDYPSTDHYADLMILAAISLVEEFRDAVRKCQPAQDQNCQAIPSPEASPHT